MSVYHGYTDLPDVSRGCVAALGNFDGVHRGHRAVIATACAFAQTLDAPCAGAVFSPHPRQVFAPDAPPFLLMNDHQRARALKQAGAEAVFHIPFSKAMAAMTPDAFVRVVLAEGLGLKGVVTGADFCFGKDRAGDATALKALGARYGVAVTIAEAVNLDDASGKISSTNVRNALREGDVKAAAALLERPFAIEGVVSKGDQRGRLLGFPTANIGLGEYLRPKFGVYAVRAHLPSGDSVAGVANLGSRPTVEGTEARLEAHLFDFEADLYGQTLEVELIDFIRPEQKFDGLEALTAQIAADSATARAMLGD
ncbi:bifunctional riboflavin kinase/FAD synthetase [Oceanicaulis sp.]|uniref:bifunctional riboflavin kinase/FAD synthetase n=1 Tax=Oceanicaulis sp. TaxID=1924941 RepID=UPI003BAD6A22